MRSFFPLLLIGVLALVGTTAAVGMYENFQNGAPSMGSFVASATIAPSTGPVAIATQAVGYQEMMYGRNNGGHGIMFYVPLETNEASFVYPNKLAKKPDSGYLIPGANSVISMYCLDGTSAGYIDITGAIYYNPYDDLYNNYRITIRRADQHIYVYVNEQLVKDGGQFQKQPAYFLFRNDKYSVDDVVIGPAPAGIVGVAPADWAVVKDLADPSMTGLYDNTLTQIHSTFMRASYNIFGDATTAQISIDGDEQVQTIVPHYVPMRISGTWYNNTPSYSGFVTFNLTEFIAHKSYGRHTVRLTTSTGTVESEFWYKAVATAATSITFDRDVYAPKDSVQVNSTIGTAYWQPGVYSYRGELWDTTIPTSPVKKETWAITSQTQIHSTAVTTDLFPSTGNYQVQLYAVQGGNDILLDTDTAYVYADKVVFSGTVWNAQQGTVLSGATVSLTQGSTTTTKTTGSDGRFEFVGLSKDVLTKLSAAKTGFVTAWSNTTPTEYKRYEVDIALAPSAPAHTGTAIFGTVRCYPNGDPVGAAAVKILKDGAQINSTTSATKGFYIFDGLQATTTYTIEVDKTGYSHYSNAATTGALNSLTPFEPWLYPTYKLNVTLKDSLTNATITRLMAVSVGGESYQTTNGTVRFSNVDMGACSIAVVGDGYEPYETTVTMDADKSVTLYITPSPVVVTTTPGMTPTPTPAIIDMGGTVYDGMTGLPIQGATVTVEMGQGGTTRSDTSDSSGAYAIPNLQNGVLTTVNATAAGYEHTPFSFTPQGAAEYVVNVVMYRTDEDTNPTIDPQPGKAGAGGMVLGGDMHLPLDSPTVTASNGTWSGDATVTAEGVWYFDSLEPNTAYDFTASGEGYVTNTVEATMGGPDSFTVVEIVLAGVYDVTIEVHDAESYAIIYKPVSLTLSNGVKGNTSTGSYVFTNLQYAQYVVTAACEGYTAGGLSFVAYGDHTEYLYLSKLPVSGGSSIQYDIPPKPVEILARNIFGVPLAGVAVSVQGGATTLPDRGLLAAFFGWGDDYSSADLANATMTGTTGSDGGITFMMTDALKYNVTFSDPARGIDETVELMPHDTQYMFILGGMGAAPVAGMPNMTLWADGAEGASPTLRGYYSDPAGTTSALYFIVERINGTVRTEVSNQSLGAVQTASPSFAVNHTTGAMYSWGFRATTPDRGALQQWNGITIHSRLVELPFEESAYFWVSMCLVFLFAGLFSGNNIKYGFVAFPMFCGVLWYIGWLDIAGITLGIVMVLGVLMYLAKVQVA